MNAGRRCVRPETLSFAPDPAYGNGACNRTIRLVSWEGSVEGHLSDNFHEMRCRIRHDGQNVLAIEGEAVRVPTTACPAAVGVLQELVGIRLDTAVREFYRGAGPRRHCTHLFDLGVLTIRYGSLPPTTTVYEATVPDETDKPVTVAVRRDGALVHRWEVRDGSILNPKRFRGNTLGKGFAAWAATTFQDADLEAATILARTWLIAIGRRYLTEQAAGQSIAQNTEMIGRCFAYAPARAVSAVFTEGQRRDGDAAPATK